MKKPHRLLPFLLFSYVVTSAVCSLYISNVSKQRVALRQSAAEEEQQPQGSEWVPIELNQFNSQIDKEIQKLNNEIYLIKEQKLSSSVQSKKLDPLERELKIQTINKEEHNLMDENKDGEIDYQEFNLRTAALYSRTYPLTHTPIEGKPEGIYDEQGRKVDQSYLNELSKIEPQTNNLFLIFVEAGIREGIASSLEQYKADILAEGKYQPAVRLCSSCTKEDIIRLLSTAGVAGTVFVGDLPSAWVKTEDPEIGIEVFPIDMYFMDINYYWGQPQDCYFNEGWNPSPTTPCFIPPSPNPYQHHLEIFFGRIDSPSNLDEVALINNYFRKNHLYRIGQLCLSKRALIYADDQFAGYAGNFSTQVSQIWSNQTVVKDAAQTTAADYKERWDDNYEHLLLAAHSNYEKHGFYVPQPPTPAPPIPPAIVYNFEVKNQRPHFFFSNLNTCSSLLYTVDDYIGGWYVFQNGDYGLLALGSTKILAWSKAASESGYNVFYQSLQRRDDFGVAFKNWFSSSYSSLGSRVADNILAFGGMTLIGDPTLALRWEKPNTPVRVKGPEMGSLINYGDPLLQVRDDSAESSCFPHFVVYSVWPPEESATAYYRSSGFLANNPISADNRTAVPWTVSPALPAGQYQWRANLKDSADQALTKAEVLKVNFNVCAQPSQPEFVMINYGEGARLQKPEQFTLYRGANLTLRIKDVSDGNTSCFPHDVIFNIWPKDANMYVRSSGWMIGDAAIHDPQGTKEYTFHGNRSTGLAGLTPGQYELRANLDNKSIDRNGNQRTIDSRAPQPLIINFTLSPCCRNDCDINCDGQVNSDDSAKLQVCFGSTTGNLKPNCSECDFQKSDHNKDGAVDVSDFSWFRTTCSSQ